jgi:hypothetical protein
VAPLGLLWGFCALPLMMVVGTGDAERRDEL